MGRESRTTRSYRAFLLSLCLVILLNPGLSVDAHVQGRQDDLGDYHTYEEMTDHLQELALANPDIVRLESIGVTYEGRDIWAVEISDEPGGETEVEPGIMLMGGHHAREFISVEVPLGMIDRLVDGYRDNMTIRAIVNMTRFWIIPMVNPDGHAYVEKGNDWRKNRRPNGDGTFGVDLNRNYGHRWGEDSSFNSSDETYSGPFAFSENETRAIRSFVENNTINISLSYHSKGGYILHPWGNSEDDVSEIEPGLRNLATSMVEWMPERYKVSYAVDFYPVTGDSEDWLYAVHDIWAYTIELSPGHRPDEGLIPGMIGYNLDALISAATFASFGGWGQVGISILKNTTTKVVEEQGAEVFVEISNYGQADTDLVLNVAVFSEDVNVWYDAVILLAPSGKRFVWTFDIVPWNPGDHEVLVFIEVMDPIQLDDSDSYFLEVIENVNKVRGCPVVIHPDIYLMNGHYIDDVGSNGVPTYELAPGGTFDILLYFEIGGNGTYDVDIKTLDEPNGLTWTFLKREMRIQYWDEGNIGRFQWDVPVGTSGYLVFHIGITGQNCTTNDLVAFRMISREWREIKSYDIEVTLEERTGTTEYLRIENLGNVAEELFLVSDDPERIELSTASIEVSPGDTVLVPMKIRGGETIKDVMISISNEDLNTTSKVTVIPEPRESDGSMCIYTGGAMLGLAFIAFIFYLKRKRGRKS